MRTDTKEIKLVPEFTAGDIFENAIRTIGAVNACEWFGHSPDSEFTKETQRVLDERLCQRKLIN
jgi:hypothetical protein